MEIQCVVIFTCCGINSVILSSPVNPCSNMKPKSLIVKLDIPLLSYVIDQQRLANGFTLNDQAEQDFSVID